MLLSVCLQVGKLYIRYQLDVGDMDEAVVEVQDVICLLKDEKELYIQKDHLSAKLEICRFVCDGKSSNTNLCSETDYCLSKCVQQNKVIIFILIG